MPFIIVSTQIIRGAYISPAGCESIYNRRPAEQCTTRLVVHIGARCKRPTSSILDTSLRFRKIAKKIRLTTGVSSFMREINASICSCRIGRAVTTMQRRHTYDHLKIQMDNSVHNAHSAAVTKSTSLKRRHVFSCACYCVSWIWCERPHRQMLHDRQFV